MYTVYLDGQIINEPMGLMDSSTLEIVRNEDISGLFTTLVTELVFWGQGYQIIMEAIEQNPQCGSIPIQIIEQCAVDPIIFNGTINLADVENDEYNCTCAVSAEDATLASLVLRLKDAKTRVNAPKTIGGESLTPVTPLSGGWIYLSDMFQHVCDYITDNELTVVLGDIFDNPFPIGNLSFQVLSSTGAAGTITGGYTDPLGIPVSFSATIPKGQTAEQIAFLIIEAIAENSIPNQSAVNMGPYAILGDVDTYGAVFFGSVTGESIDMDGTGTISFGASSFEPIGIQDVVIASGGTFKTPQQDWNISLTDLITIGTFYNLAYRFIDNNGTQELHIDHETAFFEDVLLFSLNNLKIKRRQYTPYAFSSLQYPRQDEDEDFFLFKERSYVAQSCAPNPLNIAASIKPVNTDDTTTLQNDTIYLMELNGFYQIVSVVTGSILDGPIKTSASITNHIVALLYSNRSVDGLTFEGINIPNNYSIKLNRVIIFECPLNKSQINAIIQNPTHYILANGRKGWIQSVKYRLKDGMTTFELITE